LYNNEPLVPQAEDRPHFASGKTGVLVASRGHLQEESRQVLTSLDTIFSHFTKFAIPLHFAQQWRYSKSTGDKLSIYEPDLPIFDYRSDLSTIYYLATHLKAFPITFSREARTPFIHSTLYSQWLPKHIKDTYAICRSYALSVDNNEDFCFKDLHRKVDELIEGYPALYSFSDLLSSLQSLILYLLICLFDKDPQQRKFAEGHITTLNQWTRRLWEQAPSEISHKLSPWHAWAFAESVRRSIIISYLVRGVYHITKFGYHPHSMFVETLPFDRHTWLWEVSSAAVWSSLPRDASQSIVSYHEYTDDFANQLANPSYLFESLLLVMRYGKGSFDQRLRNTQNQEKVRATVRES
jgi:hypothetical protein